MALSSSSPPFPSHLIPVDPRVYCETMNELQSYITSSKRGYLTQAELFRYYRQRHDNAEIPYRSLGYRSLLDLLSSDPRLFAIDLRREPAYIYSAVKLRQEQRERRRGSTSFSRQHHSTNTVDEQHRTPPTYVFFDSHLPLDEQQPMNIDSSDEHEPSLETPNPRHYSNNNLWHTPSLDDERSSMDKQDEKRNEQTSHSVSNSCSPVTNVRSLAEIEETQTLLQRDHPFQVIQRQLLCNEEEKQQSVLTRDSDGVACPSPSPRSRLTRSKSTSTTTLTKSFPSQFIDLYIFLCTILVSSVFLGIILYKVC